MLTDRGQCDERPRIAGIETLNLTSWPLEKQLAVRPHIGSEIRSVLEQGLRRSSGNGETAKFARSPADRVIDQIEAIPSPLRKEIDSVVLDQLQRIRAVGVREPEAFPFRTFEIGKVGDVFPIRGISGSELIACGIGSE